MAVTNQELILGGGVILLILYSMMGKKDEKEQRVVTWVDPRPPDAPEKHVEEMSESEEPLKKKKTYDDEMNDRMQNLQSTLTEIISRTNGLAQKLNIVARSTGVVGEVLKLSIIGITKRIDDFLEDIAQFRRTFQVGHQFEQYLTPWTNEALKYHHGLQAIIINSEHYKTRGDILQAIQVFTTAFLQMHPQKGQGEGYYLGGGEGAEDISESLDDDDFNRGRSQYGTYGNGYFANRPRDGNTTNNSTGGGLDPDQREREGKDAHTVADPSSKPSGKKPGPSHHERNPLDDDAEFTVTKGKGKQKATAGMTLEMLQDQISKTFHTTNDLTTTNNIISSARNTGWDPANLSNSQISVIQRNLQERESSGAHKRSSPDDPIYEPEALFGGKTQAVEAVELDLSQKQFGDHPNQETNTTGEAFGSGGQQTKPVAFGQQYLDKMFPDQGQFRLNSVEQGTKTLAGLRSYLSDLLDQSRKNQLLTKQYTTKTALGNELHARAGIASVHAQQAALSTLVKGGVKLRREINGVLGKSFVSKMLLNQDLRQAYMQSKRDNTFETASIYLKKYIDHNLQGDDQTSANLVVNETAAAFCMFRVVYRDINIGLLVKTGQVKRTKTMEGEQEPPAQSPPVYVPAPPLRRGSPAPAKKKRKVTKQKGGDNPG